MIYLVLHKQISMSSNNEEEFFMSDQTKKKHHIGFQLHHNSFMMPMKEDVLK